MRCVTTTACVATLALLVAGCSDRPTATAAPERPNFIINGTPTGNDFPNVGAVVILPAAKTRGVTPLALPRAGLLDDLAAQGGLKDQIFLNVGYGVDATLRGVPGFTFDGVRKVSKSPFMALEPFWLWLNMNSNASDLGGDCFGDSGSPKFFDGNTSLIVATVTSGDNVCRATSRDYRLDTATARAFLGQFVALP